MTTDTPNPYEPQRRYPSGAPPRRGVPAVVPLGLAAAALLEIWLLMALGRAEGGLTVVLVLLAGCVLGVFAIKRGGRAAFRWLAQAMRETQVIQAMQAGTEPPASERSGGGHALTMFGGLLLILPGLVSDAAGLLCLLPPTSALLRRLGRRWLAGASGPLGVAFREARSARQQDRGRRADGKVVRGEVLRDEDGPG
jgi:UPF0716 protein FxsA